MNGMPLFKYIYICLNNVISTPIPGISCSHVRPQMTIFFTTGEITETEFSLAQRTTGTHDFDNNK